MAEASSLTCHPCTPVPESTLSHRLQALHGLVSKQSHHKWQKHRPSDSKTKTAQENMFSSVAQRNVVFASEGVFMLQATSGMSGLVLELALRHKDVTLPRKLEELKTSKEEFLRFLLNSEAN